MLISRGSSRCITTSCVYELSLEFFTSQFSIFRTSVGIDLEMPSVECIVFNSGTILCVPFTTYTPVCEYDHTWWPYDILNCTIHIASWSHGSNEIKLNSLDTEQVCIKF